MAQEEKGDANMVDEVEGDDQDSDEGGEFYEVEDTDAQLADPTLCK
jgi:hypothetical protein